MAAEERSPTVFGKPEPITESDIIEQSMAALKDLPGCLPLGAHTGAVFVRLVGLEPKLLAGHHGSAYSGNAVQALQDLRGERFKFAGLAVEEIVQGSDEEPSKAEPYA